MPPGKGAMNKNAQGKMHRFPVSKGVQNQQGWEGNGSILLDMPYTDQMKRVALCNELKMLACEKNKLQEDCKQKLEQKNDEIKHICENGHLKIFKSNEQVKIENRKNIRHPTLFNRVYQNIEEKPSFCHILSPLASEEHEREYQLGELPYLGGKRWKTCTTHFESKF